MTEDGRSVSELELQGSCWVITSEQTHTFALLCQIRQILCSVSDAAQMGNTSCLLYRSGAVVLGFKIARFKASGRESVFTVRLNMHTLLYGIPAQPTTEPYFLLDGRR